MGQADQVSDTEEAVVNATFSFDTRMSMRIYGGGGPLGDSISFGEGSWYPGVDVSVLRIRSNQQTHNAQIIIKNRKQEFKTRRFLPVPRLDS